MTKCEKIRVSIILPVKNGENYIQAALETLIANTSVQDEIIVIDDGSTDSTVIIINESQKFCPYLNLIRGGGLGPARARNLGLLKANGKFVAFIDHDDLWPSGRLERHLSLMQNSERVDAVVGKTQYFCSDGTALNGFKFLDANNALHHVHLGASTFRRQLFEQVGLFNESLMFSEDHDFFLRIREKAFNLHFDDAISLMYRIHGTNMTQAKSLHELEIFKVLHDSIKRRRTNNVPLSQFYSS